MMDEQIKFCKAKTTMNVDVVTDVADITNNNNNNNDNWAATKPTTI